MYLSERSPAYPFMHKSAHLLEGSQNIGGVDLLDRLVNVEVYHVQGILR